MFFNIRIYHPLRENELVAELRDISGLDVAPFMINDALERAGIVRDETLCKAYLSLILNIRRYGDDVPGYIAQRARWIKIERSY